MLFLFFFYLSTLLELQPRFGDKPLIFQVVCLQNGTAVLKGLINLLRRAMAISAHDEPPKKTTTLFLNISNFCTLIFK